MYLEVTPSGSKRWRLSYRFAGKQKLLSLGIYPTTSLKEAREAREAAKKLLAQGVDPSAHRKQAKELLYLHAENSFEVVAQEWLTKMTPSWSDSNSTRVKRSLETDVFPWLGHRPISEITAPELLSVLRRVEERGAVETAHRIKQRCSMIFRYAIATGRAERDPAPDLKGALPPTITNNFAAIKEPKRIGELLRMFDAYQGTSMVKAALRLAPLVFVRPANLRMAEWSEFDLDAAQWRIPGNKIKSGEPHIVPLSSQAVAVLRDIQRLTGKGRYVFPSARAGGRPMSDNAILVAMRTMGIPKDEMTGHGFRHMASTVLHEQGWNSDVIERQLAHGERNNVKAVYNHAKHLPERTRMMQAWADYLDGLRKGAEVVPLHKRA